MTAFQIAQVNIGRTLAPVDDPLMADFTNNLDRINALAEGAPGFVWRLKGENNNATALRAFEDDSLLINMSMWESIEALHAYVYKTDHASFIKRRREWFSLMTEHHQVLWWVPAGEIPVISEAPARLAHLEAHGPTPYAFTYAKRFTIEEAMAYSPEKA